MRTWSWARINTLFKLTYNLLKIKEKMRKRTPTIIKFPCFQDDKDLYYAIIECQIRKFKVQMKPKIEMTNYLIRKNKNL
jgi:hypothetical protein